MQKFLNIIICSTLFLVKIAIGQNADVIFINAQIITAAKKGERANAMVLKEGKILFVGDRGNALKYKTATTKIIDVKNETIIPGFNDVHLHPSPESDFEALDHVLKIDTVTRNLNQ